MSESSESATEKIMSSIMDTIADNLPKLKSGHFDSGSVSDKVKNKLFGRQKTLHGVLGGGKCMWSAYWYCVLKFAWWASLMCCICDCSC
jgi:hypothetical protein